LFQRHGESARGEIAQFGLDFGARSLLAHGPHEKGKAQLQPFGPAMVFLLGVNAHFLEQGDGFGESGFGKAHTVPDDLRLWYRHKRGGD